MHTVKLAKSVILKTGYGDQITESVKARDGSEGAVSSLTLLVELASIWKIWFSMLKKILEKNRNRENSRCSILLLTIHHESVTSSSGSYLLSTLPSLYLSWAWTGVSLLAEGMRVIAPSWKPPQRLLLALWTLISSWQSDSWRSERHKIEVSSISERWRVSCQRKNTSSQQKPGLSWPARNPFGGFQISFFRQYMDTGIDTDTHIGVSSTGLLIMLLL